MLKKKVLSGLLAIAMVFGSAAALPEGVFDTSAGITASAAGDIKVSGDYKYKDLTDGTVEITGYTGKDKTVNIPSTLAGKTVTSIGDYAFNDCSSLTSITIPNSVTSIGLYAFSNCTSLTSITIPNSVTTIWIFAFSGCISLKSVTIPNSVTSIGGYAFSSCTSLTSITIPNSVAKTGIGVFYNCLSLASVTIPSGVTIISGETFKYCKGLTSITIPDSVTSIQSDAFEYCTSLESVTIPNSVTSIRSDAFTKCTSLKSLTIPKSVTKINKRAFGYNNEEGEKNNDFVVKCYKGTAAETYAKDNGFKIVYLGVTHVAAKAAACTADGNIEYWKYDGKFYSDADLTTEITQAKTVVKATGHKFSAWKTTAFDTDKNTSTQTRKCSSCGNTETQTTKNAVSRFAGAGRYETAAKISQAEFTQADTVVLANSMNYADALAGVPLAKKLSAPILLTNKATIDKATLAEIKRLKAKNVIILGGTGAISEPVENTLKKEGLKTERFEGATRYGTATAIAEKLSEKPTDIFFVFGGNYPDALSASAAAAAKNAPIIYLTKDGELNADTAKYLAKLKKAGSVKNAYVIGGTGVISDDMMKKAGNALGVAPTRVFGANRFETCIAVNEKFAGVLNGKMLCVATGMDFPDALAGGVYAAINKAPLFLVNGKLNTPKLTDDQNSYLKGKNASKITVFGGTGVVSDEFVKLIANAGV